MQRDPTATNSTADVGSRNGLPHPNLPHPNLPHPTSSPPSASITPTAHTPFQHLLFTWLSPAFPVGAFAYSHGLEMAAERKLVTSQSQLQNWLSILITQGSLKNDLLLLAHAHRASHAADENGLVDVNALALALQPSAERYLESTQQGGSFLIAVAAAWPIAALIASHKIITQDVAYPVAVGIASAAHAIPLPPTLQAFAFAFVTNLTSAAIRLGIVGQTGAQAIIAALAPALHDAAVRAEQGTLEAIGSATFSADLCSLEHETQYSRLFRS